MMRAVYLAADHPPVLLDVNNNYGDSCNKAILFHCGPAPASFMKGKGEIQEHLMFKKTYGEGSGVGVNKGEGITADVTLGSLKTENGMICTFVTEGRLTDDKIPPESFGIGVVFESEKMNEILTHMASNGYRHHVALSKGRYAAAIVEAFEKYLGYKIVKI